MFKFSGELFQQHSLLMSLTSRTTVFATLLVCCLICFGCSFDGVQTAPSEIQVDPSFMQDRAHGTCPQPVMNPLRWDVDRSLADRICCFNRRWAENSGYWQGTELVAEISSAAAAGREITFYDSVTGKPLFIAPKGRTFEEFQAESRHHGWPSFRDAEVVKANVRVLPDGETVSVDGTHLGHNLPDSSGNRYCINVVSVAGNSEK